MINWPPAGCKNANSSLVCMWGKKGYDRSLLETEGTHTASLLNLGNPIGFRI